MGRRFGMRSTNKLASLRHISWKRALGALAGAPMRLHHYRDVHTQMLHNALCDVDCSERHDGVHDSHGDV